MLDRETAVKSLLLLAGTTMMLLALSVFGHCAVPRHGDSSIGNVVYQDNPLTYKAGSLMSYNFIEKTGLVLTLQPSGTYELFQESVVVCDTPAAIDMLNGKHNPMVIAFETRDHRMVEGIGCHNLVGVYEINTEKP